MAYLIDKALFEARSGGGCSNSAYTLVRTTCCRNFAVEDDELLNLYYDPHDLTRIARLYRNQNCPFCGSGKWDFEEIEAAELLPSIWAWAAIRMES
jgi:hypothetical protein